MAEGGKLKPERGLPGAKEERGGKKPETLRGSQRVKLHAPAVQRPGRHQPSTLVPSSRPIARLARLGRDLYHHGDAGGLGRDDSDRQCAVLHQQRGVVPKQALAVVILGIQPRVRTERFAATQI